MTSIFNLINRSKILEKEIEKLKAVMNKAPEGLLIARSKGKENYRYYRRIHLPDGTYKEQYMNKGQQDIAARMAYKLYAEKKLPELIQEKNWIDRWIAEKGRGSAAEEMLKKRPGISQLLQSAVLSNKKRALEWKNAPYRRNQKYPEDLIFPTVVRDLKVRSKAEADIVGRLEHFKVPYRYEQLYTINGVDYAIDFTCLNVEANRILYWDHRGMLDKPEYIRKTLNCENAYLNAGIIQGINMIVTTETKEHPLDLQWVDELIRYYLI